MEFPVPLNVWRRFFDDRLPYWVKQRYLPEGEPREGAFNPRDAESFGPAVAELSKFFITRGQGAEGAAYFSETRFRAAYLLYWLPLQAAKFLRLFYIHPAAIRAALADASKGGVLRVADLGSGPATASLALLTWLVAEHGLGKPGSRVPRIELHLLDTDPVILRDGVALLQEFRKIFNIPAERLTVLTHATSLESASELIPAPVSLTLVGNVFNESIGVHERAVMEWMPRYLSACNGGGVLFVEPATPENSAFLSQLRDSILRDKVLPREPASVWGPCLHAGPCPLAASRDWCHFSSQGGVPGQWFKYFSEQIGTERQWLKFSYLWLAAPGTARKPDASRSELRRVISDVLPDKRGGSDSLLICEPERPSRVSAPKRPPIGRGDLVTVRPLRKKRPFGSRET